MKTLKTTIIILVLAGAAVGAYVKFVDVPTPPQLLYAATTHGDVVTVVQATGTLQATRTIDVGTQVSGVVKRMYVDYNSIVKKGDLIAEIDPALSQQALNSAQAAYDKSQIDLQGAKDTYAVDVHNRDRTENLFTHALATEQDKETAELQVKEDQATIDQDVAATVIAHAGVEQAQVNLDFCTIRSPIDGVVVQRNADEGQTVATSLAVPSLYVMATDITHLELSGQVDESDIGKLHPGQDVTFTVDAYPGQTFHGTMTHVRLYATTTNNVVTYQAIVAVPNADLRLLPSMTANMKVEVDRVSDVVRVPNTAMRFRPTRDMFLALGQTPQEVAPGTKPVAATLAPSGPSLPLPTNVVSASAAAAAVDMTSSTPMIDTMFGAVPRVQSVSQVWVMDSGKLRSVPITVGMTDGVWSQVLKGDIRPQEDLVTAIILPVKRGSTSANPLVPTRGGPGGNNPANQGGRTGR